MVLLSQIDKKNNHEQEWYDISVKLFYVLTHNKHLHSNIYGNYPFYITTK